MALYYDVRVDINADRVLNSGYKFVQNDSRQIFLRIAVMNGNVKFSDSDASQVTVNFAKSDGTLVEGTPTKVGDVYQYQFVGNELQCPGPVHADIKFWYDSGRLSTGRFTFEVIKDTTSDEAVKSAGYLSTLEQARQQAANILGEMTTAESSIAGYAQTAQNNAILAESYAHGNTGKRSGEDKDNAMYFAEQAEESKNEAYTYTQEFKYCFVMYSEYADGTDMTAEPTEDTIYTGIYTGTSKTAPTDKTAYTWSRSRGYDGNAYFATFDISDGELIMNWSSNVQDINFAINADGELEVIR